MLLPLRRSSSSTTLRSKSARKRERSDDRKSRHKSSVGRPYSSKRSQSSSCSSSRSQSPRRGDQNFHRGDGTVNLSSSGISRSPKRSSSRIDANARDSSLEIIRPVNNVTSMRPIITLTPWRIGHRNTSKALQRTSNSGPRDCRHR